MAISSSHSFVRLPPHSPLPARRFRACPSPHSLHCISAAPAALDRYPRGLTGHVAHPGRSIETHSLPTLTRCFPRSFTFYVADPVSSIVSQQLPLLSTAKHSSQVVSPAHRPCRSPKSL